MKRSCLDCGRITDVGNRCPLHAAEYERTRNQRKAEAFARRGISMSQWRKLRAQILKRDGNRCTAVVNGVRCTETDLLEVHHADGNGANNARSNLFTVCRTHHGRLTSALTRSAA